MDLKLKGHTALVTGGWRGTGLIIARHLLREGAGVLVHGFDATAVDDAIRELGAGIAVTGDIRTDAGARQVIEACLAEGVDILVNNYGTAEPGSWDQSGSGDWIDAYEKNVLSAQRLIRGLLPAFRAKPWARILNLGTVGSTRPNATMPHYYAAKGALATMTVSLARELAGTGIRVNLVSPGMILTPEVMAAHLERGRRKGWGETWEEIEPHVAADVPIRRIVRREEVADLVAFLASPLADGIHGQNYRIDGGGLSVVS
jgi:NAD(P)-dependent dehydrogenase (short-subunit alcohol dehydrogenase family)